MFRRPAPPVALLLVSAAGCREAPAQASDPVEEPAATAIAAASSEPLAPAPVKPEDEPWPPPLPAEPAGDRIFSKVRHLWVRPQPAAQSGWLGYLTIGSSVRVKGGVAAGAYAGPGHSRECEAWYAVEPVGFVCVGEHATLDAAEDLVVAIGQYKSSDSPWPYRYGESTGAPIYPTLPPESRQRTTELALEDHLDAVRRARAAKSDEEIRAIDPRLAGVELGPAGKGPPWLLEPAADPPLLRLPPIGRAIQNGIVVGSTVAYVDELDWIDRTFYLTWDFGLIPADKVRPYPEVRFHGVPLGHGIDLPLAFFREKARPKYRRAGAGFEPAGAEWPRLAFVALTGTSAQMGSRRFLETREPGMWCAEDDAVVAHSTDPPLRIRDAADGRRTWVDVSILQGTLVAYENRTPVYATLVSPGRGGTPKPGIPTLETASTPTGVFLVLGKFITATMVSGSISTLIHAEVPYTQNFNGPYALHGAYWHDQWGEPKSGGCVNLSPIDAKRIFAWGEPRLPAGWHGMRSIVGSYDFGEKTVVVVRQ
jgi:L,D-transpeptidase-like protein